VTQRRTPSAAQGGEVVVALPLDASGQRTWRSAVQAAVQGRAADLVDDLMIVAGELVANALEHGMPPASLQVVLDGSGSVLVSVLDGGPVIPLSPLPIAPGAVRGRGLAIVESLASDWGVLKTEHGKAVWARVADADDA
jgi:anti-sigma regulatory factor (Ser/Thr protein kinase)